jgi:hypothetical protein
MLNRIIWIVLLLSFIGQVALADKLSTAKFSDIKGHMDITGSANIKKQFMSESSRQIFQTLKPSRPEISDSALGVMDREPISWNFTGNNCVIGQGIKKQ